MTFPTLSHNASPFQALPTFLLVLGKKIDRAEKLQELTCVHVNIPLADQDKLETQGSTCKKAKELGPWCVGAMLSKSS